MRALDGVSFDVRARRVGGDRGPVGLGQVDADEPASAASTRPPPAPTGSTAHDVEKLSDDELADLRNRRSASSSRPSSCCRAPPRSPTSSCRWSTAGLPRAERRREAERGARGGGARATACTTGPTSSPAASGSAWPSPGRWWASRRCCSPTSPPATSTRRPARRSSGSSASCTSAATPSCWSPTSPGWRPAARAPSGSSDGQVVADGPGAEVARLGARRRRRPRRGAAA